MESEILVNMVIVLMGLLFVSAVSAFLLRQISFPYTVGLVVIGVLLAFAGDRVPALAEGLEALELSPDLILFVFIPALIFEAALNIDVRLLTKNLVPTLILAAPGLLLSTALIGILVSTFTTIPLGSALILGTLISATDPVAVIALFKDVGAPKRLNILVEGESLFNDATAIVTFQIILGVVATGILTTSTILSGLVDFFVVFFGGLIVGLGIGYLVSLVIRMIGDQPIIQLVLTLVAAYGSFIIAEHYLHTSGIMAVLGTGLVIGYYGSVLYTHRVRESLEVFWESIAFTANSLIFLMLGLSEKVFLTNVGGNFQGLLVPVLIVIVIVLAVRAGIVFGLVPLVNLIPGQVAINRAYQTVMWWGGLRGAVAVALAISLPLTFPFRWQIIDIAFGVTLFTLLVNGTTMRYVMKWLGMDRPSPLVDYVESFVRVLAKREAVKRLHASIADGGTNQPTNEVLAQYQQELKDAEEHLESLRQQLGTDARTQQDLVWVRALGVQRHTYRELYEDDLLSLDGLRELEWDLRQHEINLEMAGPGNRKEMQQPPVVDYDMQKIKQMRGLFFGRDKQGVSQVYEEINALQLASDAVLERFDEIQSFAVADDSVLADIRAYYTKLDQRADERMAELEQHFPDACRVVQHKHVYKLAVDGERDMVQHLTDSGDLPEQMADRIERAFGTS